MADSLSIDHFYTQSENDLIFCSSKLAIVASVNRSNRRDCTHGTREIKNCCPIQVDQVLRGTARPKYVIWNAIHFHVVHVLRAFC